MAQLTGKSSWVAMQRMIQPGGFTTVMSGCGFVHLLKDVQFEERRDEVHSDGDGLGDCPGLSMDNPPRHDVPQDLAPSPVEGLHQDLKLGMSRLIQASL